jgi:hypothetical protein
MISINFNLANPWSGRFENLWCRSYATPFKNKFLELEVTKDSSIISFGFRLAGRQSHGGLNMDVGLLGYSFSFNFYDNRHWNYGAGRYFIYGEEEGLH